MFLLLSKGFPLLALNSPNDIFPLEDAKAQTPSDKTLEQSASPRHKPANIVLTKDSRAVLIDFGPARESVFRQTVQHTRILTEDYAAPEQYRPRGHFGPYTDIFCLGATLFHALTGSPPPRSLERLLEANSTVKFPQGRHGPLNSAILHALQLRVQDRPQDIETFKGALTVSLATSRSIPRKNPTSQPITRPVSSASQPNSYPVVVDRSSRRGTKSEGFLSPRGLVLVTLFIAVFVAVPAVSGSGLVPLNSITNIFGTSSQLPAFSPRSTAILKLISVISVATVPALSTTPVVQKPAPALGSTHVPSPPRVPIPILARTNTQANLRAGPGVVYDRVGFLAENSKVQPVSQLRDGSWLKLVAGEWIFASLVEDIPPGLPVETNLPAPPPPTATPIPTNTPVPELGEWSLPVERNVTFLMQDGLEISIQDVIHGNDKRMQSYIERRPGESCEGCLAVELEIVNRSGNDREFLVQEDFKLFQGGTNAEPFAQVRGQHPGGLRNMTNLTSLRALAKNVGGDERVACFKGIVELSQDVRLAYSPVYIHVDLISPTPTPVGDLHYANDAEEKDQPFRTGWFVFFKLVDV